MSQDSRLHLCFAAVAEELSFTSAAARLNVAQPWLSARIRQLEARLGVQLLARTTRKVELTGPGKVLLPKAQAVRAALADFEAAALALTGSASILRIGAPPYVGQIAVARGLVDTFRTQHADVAVDLEVGWTRALLTRLAAGDLDASFSLGAEDSAAFEEIVLDELFLEIEMPADDPLADVDLRPEMLAGRSIIVFARAPNPHLFDLLYAGLKAAGAILVEESAIWSTPSRSNPGGGLLFASTASASARRRPRPGSVRRRVSGVMPVPFKVLRKKGDTRRAVAALWALAAVDRAFATYR